MKFSNVTTLTSVIVHQTAIFLETVSRIVPGRYGIGPQGIAGMSEERIKLNVLVALDVRIWSEAGFVILDKIPEVRMVITVRNGKISSQELTQTPHSSIP